MVLYGRSWEPSRSKLGGDKMGMVVTYHLAEGLKSVFCDISPQRRKGRRKIFWQVKPSNVRPYTERLFLT
jgi:hypothetical protein